MENNKKKYLVTHTDMNVTFAQVIDILGIPAAQIMESKSFDPVSNPYREDMAMHLTRLGITIIALTPEEAALIAAKQGVLAVEEDTIVYPQGFLSEDTNPPLNQDAPLWNMTLVNAPQAWARGTDGTGVNIAILDTGVAAHPDLVISGGACFITGQSGYGDTYGHGTHCAGIATGRGVDNVYGVAPNSNLYSVKVLNGVHGGYDSWIMSGLDWCLSNNIQVASMSLGSTLSPVAAWATAIQNCQTQGLVVIAAAGNFYQWASFPWVCSPANAFTAGGSTERPTAVAAIDSNSKIADFSSRGGATADWNQIGVSAPGVTIYSTYLYNSYTNMSGTSMACPHVAGLAALIIQRYPGIGPMMVKAKIAATANNLGKAPYPNTTFGYGLIDCDTATR